jgi:murein DD-endopeptidase MepM/ murein hydrolase activator NlpD
MYTPHNKLRIGLAAVLVTAGIFLLSLLVSALLPAEGSAATTSSAVAINMSDNPNAVTVGLAEFGAATSALTASTGAAAMNGTRSASHTTASMFIGSGLFVAHGIRTSAVFTARTTGGGIMMLARTAGGAASLTARATSGLFGFIGDTPVVRTAIRPAEESKVPVISGDTVALSAAHSALPAAQAITQTSAVPKPSQAGTVPQWPIHGEITTLFGVPEPPYQPIHTGIDISDGKGSGITQIRPYRPGTVIEVIHSYLGLGNHVIVDHGGGITSVYGHMYATAVSVGQQVDESSVLGLEGSTGASTGTHVHFEIRLNGTPVNPALYIAGQP